MEPQLEEKVNSESVENNKENNGKKLGGITGKGFMPGQSGNPGGRPKNTLKEYQAEKFRQMSDEEKEEFLMEISKDTRWKMAEGNPATNTDITSGGQPIIQLAKEVLEKNDLTPSPESDSK